LIIEWIFVFCTWSCSKYILTPSTKIGYKEKPIQVIGFFDLWLVGFGVGLISATADTSPCPASSVGGIWVVESGFALFPLF